MKKPRCDEIDQNLKDFINNIYLKNNKEIARLSESVEGLSIRLSDYIHSSEEYKKQREEKEAPMMEWFNGIVFSRKLIMWVLGFFAAFGSLFLMWRDIFKK